jgi:hypothetical protein
VLGRIRDRRTIPEIRPLVSDTDETVRLEAARTLVTMGDLQHVPVLVAGLDSNKLQVRYLCHEALRQATGRNFGYDHLDNDIDSRRLATYRWRKWWADQAGDPWFAKDYAADYGIDVFEAENNWLTGSQPAPMGETTPMGEAPPMGETPEQSAPESRPQPDVDMIDEPATPAEQPAAEPQRQENTTGSAVETTPVMPHASQPAKPARSSETTDAPKANPFAPR